MPGMRLNMESSQQVQPQVKHEDGNLEDNDFLEEVESVRDGTYKPRPQLAEPAVLKRTLAHLMKGLDEGVLDVDPDYQREVVWTAERMTGLINSLMENYYIPPIILNIKHHPNASDGARKMTLVCVDGKQRLSSVRAFIKGMIPCDDHRGEKWWFHDSGNRRHKVLPETTKKQFLAKEFVSFEFSDLTPDQEEDLFARVQMGVQLTLAEKMRAQTGPWQELGKQFVQDFSTITSLLKDTSRAKDFQMVLACFSQIIEVQHPSAASGIPGLRTNTLPKFVANQAALDDDTRSHLANVFRIFNNLINLEPEVFTNVERKLKGVQTFAPIEMVAIAVLISMYSETRNDKLLLGDIRYFRNILRENFADLRLNSGVWRFVWDYIDNLERVRGAVSGTVIRTAVPAGPAPMSSTQQPSGAGLSPPPRKRGRPSLKTPHLKVTPGRQSSKCIYTPRVWFEAHVPVHTTSLW